MQSSNMQQFYYLLLQLFSCNTFILDCHPPMITGIAEYWQTKVILSYHLNDNHPITLIAMLYIDSYPSTIIGIAVYWQTVVI